MNAAIGMIKQQPKLLATGTIESTPAPKPTIRGDKNFFNSSQVFQVKFAYRCKYIQFLPYQKEIRKKMLSALNKNRSQWNTILHQ